MAFTACSTRSLGRVPIASSEVVSFYCICKNRILGRTLATFRSPDVGRILKSIAVAFVHKERRPRRSYTTLVFAINTYGSQCGDEQESREGQVAGSNLRPAGEESRRRPTSGHPAQRNSSKRSGFVITDLTMGHGVLAPAWHQKREEDQLNLLSTSLHPLDSG